LELIRDRYFEEMAPELKKLKELETFLDKSSASNLRKHFHDKDFNNLLLNCLLPGGE
jgi:hypothetical protein